MANLLEVEGLTVDLAMRGGPLHAVRDVSFSMNRGETLGLVGELGCGKSMTLLALMGLLPKRAEAKARRLLLGGRDLMAVSKAGMSEIRGSQMTMIFQEPMTSLNPSYTIGNQLIEVIRRHKAVTRAQAKDRAVFLLEKVGIAGASARLNRYPHELSGGLRQRVMIAMALMCGPELIVADEPTTALDVTVQAQILNLLGDLRREFNMALIMVTHDLGIIARTTDHVAVMYAGEIVEWGRTSEVFAAPKHPYTRALLDCIPVPGRVHAGQRLGSIRGTVPSLQGELSGCAFRARCGHARDECRSEHLSLNSSGSLHDFRCILKPKELVV